MCGVQSVISIALYLSRVQKKVSNYNTDAVQGMQQFSPYIMSVNSYML